MLDKYIAWAVFVMVLASLSIIANLLQIIRIPSVKKRTSVFHVTVLSLSGADIIASAMFLMQGVRKFLTRKGMAADNILLRFAFTGCYFSVFSSCVHIIFIAVQRLIIICCPLKWKDILTMTRVRIILCLIWLSSAAFASLSAIPTSFDQPLSVLIFVSCAVITVMYILIPYFNATLAFGERNPSIAASEESRKKEVQVHSFGVMLTFFICTFPYAVARFYSHSSHLYIICDIMFAINPLIDPVLYFFLSRWRHNATHPSTNNNTENVRSTAVAMETY